jgi:fucose permease
VQSISPRFMRATSAAVLFLGITVFGGGLGPPLAGLVSDLIATQNFSALLGEFATACPGGRAAAGAPELDAACRAASAAGVRGGLVAGASLFFVSATLFYLASRTMRLELGDAPAEGKTA